MKCRFCFVVFAVVSACLAHGQKSANLPVTITIRALNDTVKAGSDVYIKVLMKNVSNQPVDCSSYYVNGTDRRFRVNVRNETGKTAKRQDIHPEMMPGSLQQCTLDAGESTVEKEDLISSLNDFSQPGKYTVQVSRVISNDEKNGLAQSNTITITVTP